MYDDPMGGYDESCHAWLVIYPSPDDRFLVPMIYRPSSEGGVQLIQLSHRNFVKLKDFEFITEDGPIISLYDKIKELIGFKTDRFEIEKAWKATASDVLQNPVLCAHRENERHEQAFAHHLDKFWRDGKDGA